MGQVCYLMKVVCGSYNLFAGTETLSLSVYEPIAIQILLGGPSPNLEGKGRVRGRVWYSVKARHTGHNFLLDTDTLSLFV